jgi:hypothetical protein
VQVPLRVVNGEEVKSEDSIDGGGNGSGNLRLRLDLNLDVEVQLEATIRENLTLALL